MLVSELNDIVHSVVDRALGMALSDDRTLQQCILDAYMMDRQVERLTIMDEREVLDTLRAIGLNPF